ncbi:MAG: NIPSNAP family protein, partial [Planctomycetales bacterium]
QAASLFNTHGMNNIAYWTPFDDPESDNTLIYLIHHRDRRQADADWKSLSSDPAWKKLTQESQPDGTLLDSPSGRIHLRSMDFSPLR